MRILEVSPFSSGCCGLWARISKESELLSKKGHEVIVFSSDIKRGSGKKECATEFEENGKVKIFRFKTFGSFGENTYFWNYFSEAIKLKPDIIITHAYRQYYSTIALKIARKLKIPCILVTHAPFLDKRLRSKKLNFAVWVYDNFIGKKIMNQYSKIFTITRWEESSLKNLGADKNKMLYVPNGIPEEFFNLKIPKNRIQNKILFFGRIAPIKDIETLVRAFKICSEKNKNISLDFVGPVEEDYGEKIKFLVKKLDLEKKIIFHSPVYELKEKIKVIDSCNVFVLPSKREAMPQALIEVMSREKIVISSKTEGGKEIIKSNENGYLFEIGNEKQLAEKILLAFEKNKLNEKIKKKARDSVKQFSWNILANKIEKIIKEETEQFRK